MDAFLELFGHITIATLVLWILALTFIIILCLKVYKIIINYYEKRKKRSEEIQKLSEQVENLTEIISPLKESILKLEEQQEIIKHRQEEIDNEQKLRALNGLKDRLLQYYHYYTSKDKNPMQAWTQMEKDAFDSLFKDYEDLGGNGYMHSQVQPEMAGLRVISIYDLEEINKLRENRK